jgi:hypothetical protein
MLGIRAGNAKTDEVVFVKNNALFNKSALFKE